MGFNIGTFFKNAAATAGRAVGTVSGEVDRGADFIAKTAQKIPIVGPVYHAFLTINSRPFAIAENILRGRNIEQSVVTGLKQDMAAVHEEAPMAQTVVSLVPGVGPLASSAIGAGLAIASGEPWDEVAMAAVKGAIPGGSLAGAAYEVGKGAMKKSASGVGGGLLDALSSATGISVPAEAKAALTAGLSATQSLAQGKSPDVALIRGAVGALSPELQGPAKGALSTLLAKGNVGTALQDVGDALVSSGEKMLPSLTAGQRDDLHHALQIGIAVQHAANLQGLAQRDASQPQVQTILARAGQKAIDQISAAARKNLDGIGTRGFDVGHGLMQYQVTQSHVQAARSVLSAADKRGFDAALALHIGRVTAPPAPPNLHPMTRAAHATTHGVRGSEAEHKASIVSGAAKTREGRTGAVAAASQVADARQSSGVFATLWRAFRSLLGLEDEAKRQFFRAGDAMASREANR